MTMNNQVDNHGRSTETPFNKEPKKGWRKVLELSMNWLSYKNKDEWLEQMRGNMSVVAVFIATLTFQMAISPPSGVRSVEENNKAQKGNILCANAHLELCPGEAALAIVYPKSYSHFLYWNTTCFIASLSVLLLLMSGIRLSHRFTIWLLSMGMSFTLTTLLVTYRIAILMVTPDPVYSINEKLLSTVLGIWIGLFSFSGLLPTLRIIIWTINDYYLNEGEGQSNGNNSTEDSTLLI